MGIEAGNTPAVSCGQCTWLDVQYTADTSCRETYGMTETSPACSKYRSKRQDLIKLTRPKVITAFTWLDGRSMSDAFVICIGAGPWKEKRRQEVQASALAALAGRDLSEVTEPIDWYPFSWQNQAVTSVIDSLHHSAELSVLWPGEVTMEGLCTIVRNEAKTHPTEARLLFYRMAGSPNGTKVLSLFCRDALRIPSYPIDRHVFRKLIQLQLPVHEDAMVKLCQAKSLDACEVARSMIVSANPDWSL